ncbi:hypothetical protein CCMSSC00406_0009337 [Pleurotus cornucopiae]|uniref:Uncharacterized protein n=1 Tax=Pleurotus cornucopiae TaxID=5321 RepID=A0ACB7J6G9_PLECO|nr:hypothetical protein CCMSSC00406_0009337 [Pleurotus cornucopiae]
MKIYLLTRDAKRLAAVLMPFARAIQCLESKETTAADVYLYWLAVVAQLKDLMSRQTSKLENSIIESIRKIVNHRFNQLINNARASNVYLVAFALDPEHRDAPIQSNPNPLAIPTITIHRSNNTPSVVERPRVLQKIGKSLALILKAEYENIYTATGGRTISDAKKLMEERNPHLAPYTPQEALRLLHGQFLKFSSKAVPFHRTRRSTESNLEYWRTFVASNDPDATIIAPLAVKLFAAVPISMVDERAMSVVTWLNGPKRRRQLVSTVSDHLIIRGFLRNESQRKERKPVTINWRDISKDIAGSSESQLPSTTSDEAGLLETHYNPLDGLAWLNNGLPSIRSDVLAEIRGNRFDLEDEFDVDKYLHVLADSVSQSETSAESSHVLQVMEKALDEEGLATDVVPDDDAWVRVWA